MPSERSSWAVGYEAFAAIMLVLIGAFHALAGISAIIDDNFYVVGEEYTFKFDTTTWGWIHLILGIVVLASGLAIFSGNVFARTVGVIVAALSAIANFMWIQYSPVWSIVIIAIDIAIIWALTAHGRDLSDASHGRP